MCLTASLYYKVSCKLHIGVTGRLAGTFFQILQVLAHTMFGSSLIFQLQALKSSSKFLEMTQREMRWIIIYANILL